MEFKGSYLGFTLRRKLNDGGYASIHSSDLGLVRTSNSNRYSENLIPNIQDKTSQIPGRDGVAYFSTNFTQRPHSIQVSFDAMKESQMRELRQWMAYKGIMELIYDETPYKLYYVKVNGTPQLKFISFDVDATYTPGEDGEDGTPGMYLQGTVKSGGRVHRGEGTLSFVSYYPYAKSRYKYSNQYTNKNIPEWNSNGTEDGKYCNFEEWKDSVNLRNEGEVDVFTNGKANLFNPGDIESPVRITISRLLNSIPWEEFELKINGQIRLKISPKSFENGWTLKIDSYTKLITDENGNIYNSYITEGDFFSIPLGESLLECTLPLDGFKYSVDYDYWYI